MMDEVQADPVLKDWEAYVTRVDLTDVKDPAVQNQIRELQNKYFPIKKTVGTDEEPLRPGDADGLAGVPIFNGGVLFSNRGRHGEDHRGQHLHLQQLGHRRQPHFEHQSPGHDPPYH
jgi:hypothetical protein